MASQNYYDPADLKRFGNITEWSKELGEKFLNIMEKSLKKAHYLPVKNHSLPLPLPIPKCALIVLMPIQRTGYSAGSLKKK